MSSTATSGGGFLPRRPNRKNTGVTTIAGQTMCAGGSGIVGAPEGALPTHETIGEAPRLRTRDYSDSVRARLELCHSGQDEFFLAAFRP